jgi:hypothetical protein
MKYKKPIQSHSLQHKYKHCFNDIDIFFQGVSSFKFSTPRFKKPQQKYDIYETPLPPSPNKMVKPTNFKNVS